MAENAHGEHDKTILKFLDQFLQEIKAVFIELPINYQESVISYLKSGNVDEDLEKLFVGAEKEGKNIRGLIAILDKIKEAEKEVFCYDSSKIPKGEYQKQSSYGKYYLKGESRDEDMFTFLTEYMKQNSGNFLLIGGGNHFDLGKHPQSGDTTLGQKLQNTLDDKFKSINLF